MNSVKETVVEVANVFKPTEIVTTFNEWRELNAAATDGNILEIVTAESTERFMRTTNLEMFGRALPLGTTVSEITVPATYRFHINLNDDTLEGIRVKDKKAFSVQYHPESSPGPHDSRYLFDDFFNMIRG